MYPHYFDNAATTRVAQEAKEAAVLAMTDCYGNASSLHRAGADAEDILLQARRQAAKALGCLVEEVYFTSGATESINIAIRGAAKKARGKRTILTTQIEHPAVKNTIDDLEKEGFVIKRIAIGKDGRYHPEDFKQAADDDTFLLSCMWVNNETGVSLPVEEIAAAVKRKSPSSLVMIDGVQGFCKLPMVSLTSIDIFCFSGHKIHAPKGVGGLYLKKGVSLPPLCFGGGQEKGLRPGTESIPLISALGEAIALTNGKRQEHFTRYQAMHRFLSEQLQNIPEVTVHLFPESVPYIFHFSIADLRSEIMLHHLEECGYYISSGSACSKGVPSDVLPNLGLSREEADGAIRVSFSIYNTMEELPLFIKALREGIARYGKRSAAPERRRNRLKRSEPQGF